VLFRFCGRNGPSDVGGNVMHGAHIASIGGTWMALIYGFAGMRDAGGRVSFRPSLPDEWSSLSFTLIVRGCTMRADINQATTTYHLMDGAQLTIRHCGEAIMLSTATPTICCANSPIAAESVSGFANMRPASSKAELPVSRRLVRELGDPNSCSAVGSCGRFRRDRGHLDCQADARSLCPDRTGGADRARGSGP
jgi:hypothetical protein